MMKKNKVLSVRESFGAFKLLVGLVTFLGGLYGCYISAATIIRSFGVEYSSPAIGFMASYGIGFSLFFGPIFVIFLLFGLGALVSYFYERAKLNKIYNSGDFKR